MANVKIIDLPTGSPESDSFLEATQVNEQAASGRSSAKIAFNALANWIAGQGADPVEYGDLDTEDETLIGALNELHGVDGYDVYDNTATYAVGDICIHSNSLQVCTTAVTVAEDFDSNKWSPTSLKALLALKQNSTDNSLTTTNKQIVPAINELVSSKADKATVVSGVTKNSNLIGDAEITVLKIGRVVFVKAHLKAKVQITSSDQILLSGLPERSGYRNANTFPCIIGNEYFNTDSEVKAVWIDGSGNLNLSSTTNINSDRTFLIDFWYYSA